MREQPKYLEQAINYQFNAKHLLLEALTHRSLSDKHNERLEFLGDALLGVIIAEELFNRFPDATEGDLTRLRSNLVKKDTLAEFAQQFELSKYILLGEGELRSGGLQRKSILADCFEAIIAAIYLDSSFMVCKQKVLQWYKDKLALLKVQDLGKDSKTILQEWLQARGYDLPNYTITNETGAAHDKTFTVKCVLSKLNIETEGENNSRRQAEQDAASRAMDLILENNSRKK